MQLQSSNRDFGGHEDTPSYDNYCVELLLVRFIIVVVIKSDFVTLGPWAE